MLTAPALRDADVESERQVILEELLMDEDSPDDRAHTLLYESLFPDHPLGRETAGERETVEAITPDDVRQFFHRWYRPASMVVAVAGGVDHDSVVAEVERRFAAPAPAASGPSGEAPTPDVVPLAVRRRRTEQAHLALGFRSVPRAGPRPRGARRAQPLPRRRHVEPAVRRDPRAAGPRLRRVLVAVGLLRRRRADRLRRHHARPTSTRCST